MFIDKDKEKRSKRQISKQRRQTTNKTKVIAISKKRDMGQVMLIVEGFQTVWKSDVLTNALKQIEAPLKDCTKKLFMMDVSEKVHL